MSSDPGDSTEASGPVDGHDDVDEPVAGEVAGRLDGAEQRIGHAERESAVSALKAHHAAGRITSQEYEQRAIEIRRAKTWADLAPPFSDLPNPHPAPGVIDLTVPNQAVPHQSIPTQAGPNQSSTDAVTSAPVESVQQRGNLLPEPLSVTLVALTPFVALVLFLATGSWEWFLAIPIMGVLVYGPKGSHGPRPPQRSRHRHRD